MASPAAARGQALFARADVACASCHGGAHFTNNQSVEVGTRGTFQVPSLLGLRWRAPYMHDGCAPTLRDRFGACGGGDRHGRTSMLTRDQLDDLTAYLETL
jgi:cytochrome c peroxidase